MKRFSVVLAGLAVALTGPAAGAAKAARPALISPPGAGGVSLATAQQRVSFVIYSPSYLPRGAGQPRLFLAPALRFGGRYIPERVYANYATGLTLWQMPSLGRSLASWSIPVSIGDRTGWASTGPGADRTTVEWIQGDTQLGVSAGLPMSELLKIAGSAVQAAPDATMAGISLGRPGPWAPPPPPLRRRARIGVVLATGTPQRILWVEPEMPAARAGLRPDDAIVEVDGRPTAGAWMEAMANLLRGEPGSTVRLTVLRKGVAAPLQVVLRREYGRDARVVDMTLAQAKADMPFHLLVPQWLPPGYTLLGVSILTRSGRPQRAQLAYVAPGKPLLLIQQQTAAKSTRQASGGDRITAAGPGGVVLDWTQGGTALALRWGMFAPAQALRISRSMR